MSGIYIPDKELPESCGKCFIDMITDAFPACKAAKNYEEGKALIIEGFGSGERPANCPLVPDHGDLIDYNFCVKNYELLHDDDGNPVYAVRMRDITSAPTIIPADKEEQT